MRSSFVGAQYKYSVITRADLDTKWYSKTLIDNILEQELKGRQNQNIVSLPAIQAIPVDEDFNGAIREAKKLAKRGKTVLMPLNINGKHWVSGMMKVAGDGKFQFFYNDSLGNEIDQGLIGEMRKLEIIDIADIRARQQQDGYNCGPLTIHNLLQMGDANNFEKEELRNKLLASYSLLNLQELRKTHSSLNAYIAIQDKETEEVCKKILTTFGRLENEGKVHEENGAFKRFDCDSSKAAQNLAEEIKKAYEDLGIVPCDLERKEGGWIVRIPEACRGKEVFNMNPKELKGLRGEIEATKTFKEEKFNREKFTKRVEAERNNGEKASTASHER
jgi:hypothetical protein